MLDTVAAHGEVNLWYLWYRFKSLENQQKDNRQLQLMKMMAQLKLEVRFCALRSSRSNVVLTKSVLKAEISQLESTYRSDDSKFSPYLVPDTSVLCHNLKMVQDLSRMNKFILIIPLVGKPNQQEPFLVSR